MHDEPRQQLCQLIAQYGHSLSEDPRRCGALLKDYCGQYKREIFVLVNALENRVATELLNASAGVPEVILLSRLSKRLEDELGLAETAAKWAVETWALALGVISQPLPVSVAPTPVQKTQPVSQGISSPAIISSVPFAGGKLKFPKFSVGKVKIGGKEQAAVGEIDVPQGQMVELRVSDDMTDFSFLEKCDPDDIVKNLNLYGCKNFGDGHIKYINKFNNLQFLDLTACNINGYSEEWGSLSNLKNLQSLNLSGCGRIKNSVLKHISDCSNLQLINLTQSGYFIDDNGLNYLRRLTNLKSLSLTGNQEITGPGVLTHLGEMTHLDFLNLDQCKNVNPARLQELKQMLPNTRILP